MSFIAEIISGILVADTALCTIHVVWALPNAYTWNAAYINRAEAYLYAGEYDKGLADIESYFNSLRRWKEADDEAEIIKALLMKRQAE